MKERLIETFPSKLIGVYRIVLGAISALMGSLKLTIDDFEQVWSIQLSEIRIPYCVIFLWTMPLLEILAGGALIIGYLSRVAAFALLPVLAVSIYVYLTVGNPEAFLAPPHEALLPSVMIMLATTVLIYGGGSWSVDLRISNKD